MSASSDSSLSSPSEAQSQGSHHGDGSGSKEQGEQRVFTCTVCFRNFNRLLHLQRHEYIHSDFKPFKCPWCPKSFTRQDSLVRHARLHCKKQEDTQNVSKALHKHKACMNCTEQGQCPRCAGYNRRPLKKKPSPMPALPALSPFPPAPYSPRHGSAPPRFTVGWRPYPTCPSLATVGTPYSAPDTRLTRSATSLPTMTVTIRSPEPPGVPMAKSASAGARAPLLPLDTGFGVLPDRNVAFAAGGTTTRFTRLDSPPHLIPSTGGAGAGAGATPSPPCTTHDLGPGLPVSMHVPPVSPALTRRGTPFVPTPGAGPTPPLPHGDDAGEGGGVQGMLLDMLRTCQVMEISLRSPPRGPQGPVPAHPS